MPIQDRYPEAYSHCYGCGRLNEHGLQIKSFWEGDTAVCVFQPKPYHIAVPGYVYGGLIASLIDCHSIGTASAGVCLDRFGSLNNANLERFVTGTLHVEYLKPTPLGEPLEIRARVAEIRGRKVTVRAEVSAAGVTCARGEVIAIRLPEEMMPLDGLG